MNDSVLEPTSSQLDVEDEEFSPNSEMTSEEMEDDRFAHLLLAAWTAIVKEDQETDEPEKTQERTWQRGRTSI